MISISGISKLHLYSQKLLPITALVLLPAMSSVQAQDVFEKESVKVEVLAEQAFKTQLPEEELKAAPSPIITIANEEKIAGIVIDLSKNKLYRYDSLGNVTDGYIIASGKLGKNGKSITGCGIRMVDHIEKYPYSGAYGTKRKLNPKAYGPNVLYLVSINPKDGSCVGSNGEFIHGNNDFSSLGKYASKGCIRMENAVIRKFADEVEKGTYVLIK